MRQILLIDDDQLVRSTLERSLSRAGYTVHVASNGNQGLDILSKESVDIVVTDIIMPEKEGIETIIEMRKIRSDLPIIAISGGGRSSNFQFLELSEKLGANYTLKKPFKAPQLVALIEKCFEPKG